MGHSESELFARIDDLVSAPPEDPFELLLGLADVVESAYQNFEFAPAEVAWKLVLDLGRRCGIEVPPMPEERDKATWDYATEPLALTLRREATARSRSDAFDRALQLQAQLDAKYEGLTLTRFAESDRQRIQTLLDEIRSAMTSATEFEVKHQQRMLRRLEKLQAELHKSVSDLDRFWGFIGDCSEAMQRLGKGGQEMGKAGQEIAGAVREILQIVYRTQLTCVGLPAPGSIPLLSPPTTIGE